MTSRPSFVISSVNFEHDVQEFSMIDGSYSRNVVVSPTVRCSIEGVFPNGYDEAASQMRGTMFGGRGANVNEHFARMLVPHVFEELERLRAVVLETTPALRVQQVAPEDEERREIDLG